MTGRDPGRSHDTQRCQRLVRVFRLDRGIPRGCGVGDRGSGRADDPGPRDLHPAAGFRAVPGRRDQALTAAAAAAARAASLQPTRSDGLAAARAETQASLSGQGSRRCTQIQVGLDAGAFQPGGTAVVSLTCTLPVGALTGAGLPGHLTQTVTSRAPIDYYTTSGG